MKLVARGAIERPETRYLALIDEHGTERKASTRDVYELLTEELRKLGVEPMPVPEPDRAFGPGKYDPVALESFQRKRLTQNELEELAKELAAKYNPTNMTGVQFDSFLDDLVKEGVLSENELGILGYHGTVVVGSIKNGNAGIFGSTTVDTDNPHWETYLRRYGYGNYSLLETNGNALDHVRLTLMWSKNPQGSEEFVKRIQTQNDALREMERILEAMKRVHNFSQAMRR